MKKIVFLSCLFLSSCVSNRVLFVEPKTNTPIYEAQCNAYRHTMGDCWAKAAETCPNGFLAIKANDEISGLMSVNDTQTRINGSSSYNANTFGNIYGNNLFSSTSGYGNFNANSSEFSWGGAQLQHKRSLIYICKE